MTGAVTTNKHM